MPSMNTENSKKPKKKEITLTRLSSETKNHHELFANSLALPTETFNWKMKKRQIFHSALLRSYSTTYMLQ